MTNYAENRTVRGRTIAGFALLEFRATVDPASVAANTATAQALTFTGVEVGDIPVSLIKATEQAGVSTGSLRVSAANTVQVVFINPTAGAVDPVSEEYILTVLRPDEGQGPGLS